MKTLKRLILGGLIGTCMFVLTGCGTTTVNLNKYVTIESSGYDSMGTAMSTFDYDAFEDDFSGKIKLSKNAKSNELAMEFFEGDDPSELLIDMCVSRKLDKYSDLSNGDIVTLEWDCDEEVAKNMFNVVFKYSDVEHKVAGLKTVELVNLFDYVNVTFSGISPNGQATITTNDNHPAMQAVSFFADKMYGLKNGDVFVVKIALKQTPESFVNKYGCLFVESEKEYVVDGLAQYVDNIEDVSDDLYEKMLKQGEDECRAYVANVWSNPENLQEINMIGTYFLNAKEGATVEKNNQLYYIFEITGLNSSLESAVTSYFYVAFDDIMLLPNGECSVDLAGYRTIYYTKWFANEYFVVGNSKYVGYENLDTLFNKCIVNQIGRYEYTTTVLQ